MNNYVLAIKRIRDYLGGRLENPIWEYATYDNFSGPMSSGYPIFADIRHAIFFKTREKAAEWFEQNCRDMVLSDYDKSTLCVQEMAFKTVMKASNIRKENNLC